MKKKSNKTIRRIITITVILSLSLIFKVFATADMDLTDDVNTACISLPISSVTPIGNGLCKVVGYDGDGEGIAYENEVNEYLQLVASGNDHHLDYATSFSIFEDEKYKYFVDGYGTYDGNKSDWTDNNYKQVTFEKNNMIKMKDKFSFEPLLIEKYLAGTVKTSNEYNKYVQNQNQKRKAEKARNELFKAEDKLYELWEESDNGGAQNISEKIAEQESIVNDLNNKYKEEEAKVKIGPNEKKRLDEIEAEGDRLRAEGDKVLEDEMKKNIAIEQEWLNLAPDYYKRLSLVKIKDPEKNYFKVSDINESSCKTITWYPYDTREKLTAYYKEKSDGSGIYYYSKNESGSIVKNFGYEIIFPSFILYQYYDKNSERRHVDAQVGIKCNLYDIRADRSVWASELIRSQSIDEREERFKNFFNNPKNSEYPWGTIKYNYSIWGDKIGGTLNDAFSRNNPYYSIFDHYFVGFTFDGTKYYVEFLNRSEVDENEYYNTIIDIGTEFVENRTKDEIYEQHKNDEEWKALRLITIATLQKKEYGKLKFFRVDETDKLNQEYQNLKPKTDYVINKSNSEVSE